MIRFNCQVDQQLPYTQLLPFQGALKSSSAEEIAKLADSLLADGLVTPFVVWHKLADGKDQPHFVIDGHRRLLAIQHIAQTDPGVLAQEYPVLYVEAPDIETAKKQLLLICSSYGKITSKGMQTFLSDAPSISLDSVGVKVKLPQVRLPKPDAVGPEKVVLRIRINKSDLAEVAKLLGQAGIEVL